MLSAIIFRGPIILIFNIRLEIFLWFCRVMWTRDLLISKKDTIGLLRVCAISERRTTEGLLFPVSILWRVIGLIPTLLANCLRVSPFFLRSILIFVPISFIFALGRLQEAIIFVKKFLSNLIIDFQKMIFFKKGVQRCRDYCAPASLRQLEACSDQHRPYTELKTQETPCNFLLDYSKLCGIPCGII